MLANRTAALLTMLSLLSACAMNDQNLTRAQGAGAGAALGAGLGVLIGDDTESTLIGAAAGGLAGLAIGDAIARKKADYATEEDMVVEERRIVIQETDRVLAENARLKRQLNVLNREIAALEADVEQGLVKRGDRRDLQRRATADLGQARRRLAEVNQEIAVSRGVYQEALRDSGQVDLADWDRRIKELERRRDALVTLIDDFEASTQRIA